VSLLVILISLYFSDFFSHLYLLLYEWVVCTVSRFSQDIEEEWDKSDNNHEYGKKWESSVAHFSAVGMETIIYGMEYDREYSSLKGFFYEIGGMERALLPDSKCLKPPETFFDILRALSIDEGNISKNPLTIEKYKYKWEKYMRGTSGTDPYGSWDEHLWDIESIRLVDRVGDVCDIFYTGKSKCDDEHVVQWSSNIGNDVFFFGLEMIDDD